MLGKGRGPRGGLAMRRPSKFASINEKSGPDHRDHLPLVFRGTVSEAHAHAAEPDGRDFQAARSEFALLHHLSFEQLARLFQVRETLGVAGIPILPIYCLFLLALATILVSLVLPEIF